MIISIDTKRHTHPVPQKLKAFLTDVFRKAKIINEKQNLDDEWKIVQGRAMKGTAHSHRFKVIKHNKKAVTVIVKPGDNGTARECFLTPPPGGHVSVAELYEKLLPFSGNGVDDQAKNKESEMKSKPVNRAEFLNLVKAKQEPLFSAGDLAEAFILSAWEDKSPEDQLSKESLKQVLVDCFPEDEITDQLLDQAIKDLENRSLINVTAKKGRVRVKLSSSGQRTLQDEGREIVPIKEDVKKEEAETVSTPGNGHSQKTDDAVLSLSQSLKTAIESLMAEIKAQEANLKPLREEIDGLQAKLEVAKQALSTKVKTLDNKHKTLAKLQASLQALS